MSKRRLKKMENEKRENTYNSEHFENGTYKKYSK